MDDNEEERPERPDWRDKLSDPPVPHTLPELMLLALDMADEDADLHEGCSDYSNRQEFRGRMGYDLYEELRNLLTGPLFVPTDPVRTAHTDDHEIVSLDGGMAECRECGWVPA